MTKSSLHWGVASIAMLAAPVAAQEMPVAGAAPTGRATPIDEGAVAQASPAASARGADAGIADIIVTAQKRSESLQSTPVAVSAFSTAMLEQKQITGPQQLQYSVPSLTFAQLTGYSQLSLRGIGSDLTVTAGEPTVATFQDGVYTGQLFSQSVPSFDLERIEVLRGPQGTLYGRNSTGGTINYISRLPQFEPGANAALTVGDYARKTIEAGVTGPLAGDVLAIRLSGKYADRDGYRHNLYDNSYEDADHQVAGQGALLFKPGPGFQAILRGDVSYQRSTPVNQFIAALPSASGQTPETPVGIFSLPAAVLSVLPGPIFSNADLARLNGGSVAGLFGLSKPGMRGGDPTRTTDFYNDFPSVTTVKLRGTSLTMTGDIGAATLKSITAYRYSSLFLNFDNDGSSAALVNEAPITQTSKQFTQEFNLSGKGFDNRLQWLLGAYYFHDRALLKADIFLPALGDLVVASGSFTSPAPPPVFNLSQPYIPILLQLIADPRLGRTLNGGVIPATAFLGFGANQSSRSTAGFGQATFNLTSKLHVTGGLRYTKDTKEVDRQLHSNFVPAAALCDTSSKKSWDAVTGTAGVDYQATEQTLAYAKASRGYKAGGFNPAECTASFNPETIWSYEAGVKTTFAEGQARVNMAGFYYTFDNIQFTVYRNNASFIQNAASAKLYGVELEYTVRPRFAGGLQLDGSGSYIHSAYGDQLLQEPLGSTQNIGGNELIRAPRWKLNLGGQYRLDAGGVGSFTLRGDGSYSSTVYHDIFNGKAPNQAGTVQPAFWIANARLTWRPVDDRFDAQLFVENITNELYAYNRLATNTGSFISGQFSPPRTFGVRLSMKLGSAR